MTVKKKDIRLGVVGYGAAPERNIGRGRSLLQMATRHFEGVQAAAICDISPHSLAWARKEFPDAQVYEDFDAMLDATPLDAVIIETPASIHTPFAVKLLERNIHVLSDIPCVSTVDEAWELWAAQQKSKAFYMTGANPNMAGWVETALDLKKRGLLGEPFHVEASYIHDCRSYWKITPWRKPAPGKKKFPIQYCTHSLGPVLRLMDEDLEWVTCFDTGSHINREEGQHDASSALFRTRSQVVVHLMVSFINNTPYGCSHYYRLLTTKGAFVLPLAYRTFQSTAREAQQRTLFYSTELYGYKNWIELPIDKSRPEHADKKDTGHAGMDYAMMSAFLEAVRSNGPSPISLREGLRMTLPGIYAAESARNGGALTRIHYPWNEAEDQGSTGTGNREA